ncbi:hypothetical protein C8R45DRAFT_928806 [Mycena sanguinolenta]|nr:hypothetical protein C8R45DRAFT_928806 [Mycena sanguinolenta]
MADHSVPLTLIQAFRSDLSSDLDVNGHGLEKPPTSPTRPSMGPSRGRTHFDYRAFVSKLWGPPGIVICGQLLLLIAAWGFFAAVQTRPGGFIALPSSKASWVTAHTRLVTSIFTMISTGLSLCSSFLFSWGVRQSITLRLRGKGMPLAGFLSSLKISSRSLILDPKNRRWSVMSMAVLILTVVQTPCWSSLISPSQMDFEAPLNGTEIDLTNPRLQSLQSTGKLDYCVIDTSQTESGYSALKGDMDLQATLTLMDQTFNLATGGTLPQTFDPVNTTSWFVGTNITHIPSNIESVVDLPESLDFSSYTAKQQGFTADVSCEFQALPNDTTIQFFAAQDWNGGIQRTLSLYQMNSTCVPPAVSVPDGPVSYTEAYIAGDPNYILMVACGGESDAYTLIFRGAGRYGFMDTMVCTVAPKVTSVQVDYSATGTINSKQLTDGDPVDAQQPTSSEIKL